MNGPIAQLVAITLHGNGILSGSPAAADFLRANTTAQFCETVRFVRFEKAWFGLGKETEVQIADTPDQWFCYLKERGAERLMIRWQESRDTKTPDRMLAGFVGGGGVWTLNIRFMDGHCERWMAKWAVGDQKRPDRRIWWVTYACVSTGSEAPAAVVSEENARATLKTALTEIQAFSLRMKCDTFTQSFERGLKALAHEPNADVYHQDLWPAKLLPSEAEDLLIACQYAWVFGGMGSWNDMGFDGADGKEYERVSEQLFRAVTAAIPSAVECTGKR